MPSAVSGFMLSFARVDLLLDRFAERFGNDALRLVEEPVDASLLTLLFGDCRQRIVDDDAHAMWADEEGAFTHDLVRSLDGDRNYWHLEHGSKGEGSLLEAVEVAVGGASPFGEDDQRSAALKGVECLTEGVEHACCATFVDPDLTRLLARDACYRNLLDALAKHPSEVVPQTSIEQEDVECTIVVGNEDVGGVLVDLLAPLDREWGEAEPTGEPAPDDSRPIAHVLAKPD